MYRRSTKACGGSKRRKNRRAIVLAKGAGSKKGEGGVKRQVEHREVIMKMWVGRCDMMVWVVVGRGSEEGMHKC